MRQDPIPELSVLGPLRTARLIEPTDGVEQIPVDTGDRRDEQ
jgi:hypothetical protein